MSRGSDSGPESGNDDAARAYTIAGAGGNEAERLRRQALITLGQELPELVRTLPEGGRFVDLGSGSGVLADAVARVRSDVRVWGFDIDPDAVAKASQIFGDRPNLRFGSRDLVLGPPEGFEPADAACLRLVLMHISHPVRALQAAGLWLRPGGILHLLETDDRRIEVSPRPPWFSDLLDLMQALQIRKGGNRHLGGDLEGLASEAGLVVLGRREIALESKVLLAAFSKVFLPVADYYLDAAKRGQNIPVTQWERIRNGVDALKSGDFSLEYVSIPLFHIYVGFH